MKIISAGATDIGLRRSNNEDAYLLLPEAGAFAVADGMGGAAAGEIASGIFVEIAGDVFGGRLPESADDAALLVREVFTLANQRMIDDVRDNPGHKGMGCTAELLVLSGDHYVLGHVGDSRSYLFRQGELRQITKDHSLVQQQVDSGVISKEEAQRHPMKNVVLRALGAEIELSLDLIRGRIAHGDIFLLCSDGLTDMVDDEGIGKVLASRGSLECKVQGLLDAAKETGGRDNITAVLTQAAWEKVKMILVPSIFG